jgi:hypothetical protein
MAIIGKNLLELESNFIINDAVPAGTIYKKTINIKPKKSKETDPDIQGLNRY